MRAWTVMLLCAAGACAPLAAQNQADAAFRKAVAAQIGGDAERAETEYRRIISLGFNWSPVWNNLAVIAVKRHEYIQARRFLGTAVQANDRDVVALTNYGVMSYYLADLKVAQKSLEEARALRTRLIQQMPSGGRNDWQPERYAKATEPLDRVAAKYLDKIARAELADGVAPVLDDFVAESEQHAPPRTRM
jgi:Tfp pilus assembly protein PilF